MRLPISGNERPLVLVAYLITLLSTLYSHSVYQTLKKAEQVRIRPR